MRVLVIMQGGAGGRLTGPEIRAWALAKALAEDHAVTVAVDDPAAATRDGLRLISNHRRELLRTGAPTRRRHRNRGRPIPAGCSAVSNEP